MTLPAARARALRMIAQRAPLAHVLAHLATTAEELCEHSIVVSIRFIDRDGFLRDGASPTLPPDFREAFDDLMPDPELSTCAAAAAAGEIVVTQDILADKRWSQFKHLAARVGLRAIWSMPIKSPEGRVLGTFGSYLRDSREPTEREKDVVSQLVPLAAEAILSRGAD